MGRTSRRATPRQGYPPQAPPVPPAPPRTARLRPAAAARRPTVSSRPPPGAGGGSRRRGGCHRSRRRRGRRRTRRSVGPVAAWSTDKGQRVSLRKQDGTALRGGDGSRLGADQEARPVSATARPRSTWTPRRSCSPTTSRWTSRTSTSYNGVQGRAGYNRTGAGGGGDDESIVVNLRPGARPRRPTIIFVVTSSEGLASAGRGRGHPAGGRDNPTRLYALRRHAEEHGTGHGQEVQGEHGWKIAAIGEPVNGKQPLELIPTLGRFL